MTAARRSNQRVKYTVNYEDARARVMKALSNGEPLKASQIAAVIWPTAKFLTPQGAALSAQSIIHLMKQKGLIEWKSIGQFGYVAVGSYAKNGETPKQMEMLK